MPFVLLDIPHWPTRGTIEQVRITIDTADREFSQSSLWQPVTWYGVTDTIGEMREMLVKDVANVKKRGAK